MAAPSGSPFPFTTDSPHPRLTWELPSSQASHCSFPQLSAHPNPHRGTALTRSATSSSPHPGYQFRSRGCTKETSTTSSCPGLSQQTPASPCTGQTGSCWVLSLCWGALPAELCLPAFPCYKPPGKLPQAKRRKAKRANLYNIKKNNINKKK